MSKKAGKGKKKGGKGKNFYPQYNLDDGEEKEQEKINILDFKVKTLQMKRDAEQERAENAKKAELEIRSRIFELDKDLKKEKDKLYSTTADMTRQFKQMQEELGNQVNELKQTVLERQEQSRKYIIHYIKKVKKEKDIKDIQNQNDYQLKKKDDEISDLKRKIEEMSGEFSKMLKDTLDKMKERIDQVQWNNDVDPAMMKRLKDIAGISNN